MNKPLIRGVLLVFASAALLGAGYFAGNRHAATNAMGASVNAAAATSTGDKVDPKTGRKVL
ncbi:hypothetical protein LMG22037_02702 [Paraburkholderia phenoliruptrix]|uniref:Uncharacterized protein n=1 Tax=Paraburkholderia phenoliruptrix TaxID=252970 RepID=A0A6J5AZC8_9BURK|nr:hypothetical protein LMG22037_02702 [Paraburkholderia phenoliruptrix]